MAKVRKIKAAFVSQDIEDYLGEETYLFYAVDNGDLRISDGTPGGKPVVFPGTAPPAPAPMPGGSAFLDGGNAFSVYTSEQIINGGDA